MQKPALPMTKAAYACVPDWLRERGILVEPRPRLGEFEMHACRRDGVTVFLSMTQPPHWASATDARTEVVIVGTLGESLFRFWRLGRERRLQRDILETLRPHEWRPGSAGC
jgi:hypothetical protein